VSDYAALRAANPTCKTKSRAVLDAPRGFFNP